VLPFSTEYHARDFAVNTFVCGGFGTIAGMDTLPSRLTHARSLRDWTQQELADQAGVKQSTIGNIEAGIRGGLQSLALIAEALGVRFGGVPPRLVAVPRK
jgi:DNA-binding XRE family transcriptional regulator